MGKRIAIVTPTYPPYRGGIGTIAAQDAAQLRAFGHAVDVYAPVRKGGEGVRRLHAWFRYGNAAFVPGTALIPRRYDVVFLHYPFFGGAEPLACAKRLFGGGKLIAVYHMDVVGRGLLRPFFAAHTRLCMPRILRTADRIVVTSLDYAAHSNARSVFTRRNDLFRELPPSVDIGRFSPGPKPDGLLRRYGIGKGRKVVLFVGGLDAAHYFKGVPSLLAAMTTSPLVDAHAVIVGDGDLREGFERQAKDMGVADRVTFAGPVTEDELPDHYRLADVFAFPSLDRSEAFGIAALEAFASGIPVVASDLPGVRTIVRSGETGMRVPPGSVSALAARLGDLLGDDAARRTMGAEGRRMAETEYAESIRQERLGRIVDAL